jgi:hypothetical protein
MNEAIRILIDRISLEWPPINLQESILEGSYRLASLHSFTDMLKQNMDPIINIHTNAKPIDFSLLKGLTKLKDELMKEVRISLSIFFLLKKLKFGRTLRRQSTNVSSIRPTNFR